MIAPALSVKVHHGVPRCLLRLRDRADERKELDGEGIQRWMDYECEALRFGVELGRDEHRKAHAGDFARWGRRGGLATARRYRTAWITLLARRLWERITADALAEAFVVINGGRS